MKIFVSVLSKSLAVLKYIWANHIIILKMQTKTMECLSSIAYYRHEKIVKKQKQGPLCDYWKHYLLLFLSLKYVQWHSSMSIFGLVRSKLIGLLSSPKPSFQAKIFEGRFSPVTIFRRFCEICKRFFVSSIYVAYSLSKGIWYHGIKPSWLVWTVSLIFRRQIIKPYH